MPVNYGKAWENKIREDWKRTLPDSLIERIYDTANGLVGVTNLCDMIGYKYPCIYLIEAKSHKQASFPLVNLTQYDKLASKVGITGVRVGVLLWLIDKDIVMYIPIKTITQLKKEGIKSFNPDRLPQDKYRYFIVPAIKKRVFMECDYSFMTTLQEED